MHRTREPKWIKRRNINRNRFIAGVRAARSTKMSELRRIRRMLNKDIEFDHALRLGERLFPEIRIIFDELAQGKKYYKINQKLNDLNALLANLLKIHVFKKRKYLCISVYRFRNRWSKKCGHSISYSIISLMDDMVKKGYMEHELGKSYKGQEELNMMTRIWATKALKELIRPSREDFIKIEPKELILLKSKIKRDYKDQIITNKSGTPKRLKKSVKIKYKETPEIHEIIEPIRKRLEIINTINNKALIQYPINGEMVDLNRTLLSEFLEDFNHYGRLHSQGSHGFQSLPEEERKKIMIDGEPTVEWDYSAMHPRLLYAIEGVQVDLEKDLYDIPGLDKKARPFIKMMVQRMINCKNRFVAKKSCESWLQMKQIKKKKKLFSELNPKVKKQYKFVVRVRRLGITDPEPIMRKVEAHLKEISKYFYKGKEKTGLKLMNLDSKIALDVCTHFADQGIPILPIHDSFIVQKNYSDELMVTMDKMFQKHTNGFLCPIK